MPNGQTLLRSLRPWNTRLPTRTFYLARRCCGDLSLQLVLDPSRFLAQILDGVTATRSVEASIFLERAPRSSLGSHHPEVVTHWRTGYCRTFVLSPTFDSHDRFPPGYMSVEGPSTDGPRHAA